MSFRADKDGIFCVFIMNIIMPRKTYKAFVIFLKTAYVFIAGKVR